MKRIIYRDLLAAEEGNSPLTNHLLPENTNNLNAEIFDDEDLLESRWANIFADLSSPREVA